MKTKRGSRLKKGTLRNSSTQPCSSLSSMPFLLFPLTFFPFFPLQTFHTPSLGDEEFEIPPISLDSDPSLAVSDVVGHFDDLADPSSSQDGSFSAQYGVQTLDMPVGMTHGLMEQGGGLLSGGLTMVRGKTLSSLPKLVSLVVLGEIKVTLSSLLHLNITWFSFCV